jgi:hypothetical protein
LDAVGDPEVVLDVRDELSVRGMIRGLDPDDALLERRRVFVEIPQEMQLRSRRSHDEDLLGARESLGDLGEEVVQVVGVMVLVGRPLGVAMEVVRGRPDKRLVKARGAYVKNARLLVIYPDSRTGMKGHLDILPRTVTPTKNVH